ncbi:O46/O134 family O-antigen flippase, partial [Escherichia coli]
LKVISFFIISGAPLFLSEISILIYTRLTNLYLGQIKDIDAVGIFNASYVLATAWTVVPLAFVTSVFTIIYKEKDISNRALIGTFLTLLMLFFGFLLVILCYFFKQQIISIVYGSGFELSSSILPVLILGSVFSLLGVISYRMIISMHGYKYIAKKMVIMGVISIPLN